MQPFRLQYASVTLLVLLFLPPHPLVRQLPTDAAIYQITFESTWSNETHPHSAFPGSAHFSPLIGATHTLTTTLWLPGALASPGIEEMAETGATTLLRAEIAEKALEVGQLVSGAGLGQTPGTVTIPTITVDDAHPAVTLVTMIAPSPDWFIGVHGLSLRDGQGGWYDELVVELYPYDAGSDEGTDYTSPNAESVQHQPISSLQDIAPFSNAPIGTLTFTRLHQRYLPVILR